MEITAKDEVKTKREYAGSDLSSDSSNDEPNENSGNFLMTNPFLIIIERCQT